jgi:ABC-type Fe3+-hydroxamate transport system substrate-binding protein
LLTFTSGGLAEKKEKLPSVTVIFLGLYHPDLLIPERSRYRNGVKTRGYILDKEEEAEELLQWREGWLNKIKSRTEGLSEDKKPLVLNIRYRPGWNCEIFCKG